MYKHVLIASDGSDLSTKGVAAGLELAKLAKAKVTILTVSEAFPVFDLVSKLGLFQDPAVLEGYNTSCGKWADKVLASATAAAAAEGVECETLYIAGSSPADAILETAKFRSCDLIVVASHGLRGFERFVIGSQASRVVQGASVPVLVVR